MPFKTLHPSYSAESSKWTRCRDAYDGQDAIKRAGTKYLPKLSGMKDSEYGAYKQRALFYSITSKTVDAMVGMVQQRPPVIHAPDDMKKYFVEKSGVEFYEIVAKTVRELLLMGRFGLMVDRSPSGGDPFIRPYLTESIINWDEDDSGQLTMVVLKENVLVRDGAFRVKCVEQYRHIYLQDGKCIVDVYLKDSVVPSRTILQNFGKELATLPFWIVTPYGVGSTIEKPPMLDIVDLNLSHYLSSADLEHGRHYTALPTPVVTGTAPDAILRIGSSTAWCLQDPQSRAFYLEFTGQGLQSLEKALTEKQAQMASLSSRLMDNSKRGSEAPDTVRLRYASETATLSMIARATEAVINLVYKMIAEMKAESPDEVSIELNKEFLDSKLQPTQVTELFASYFSGGMDIDTLVYTLRRGDALDPSQTDDEVRSSILKHSTANKPKPSEKENETQV